MDRLPTAWRPGIVAVGIVLLACALARPSSIRRTWQRARRLALAAAVAAAEVVVLLEHRITRWRRARRGRPIALVSWLSDLVDRKVLQPCEARRAAAEPVRPVRRRVVAALVVAGFAPSAAWIVMAQFPGSAIGRSTRAAFDGWESIEDRLRSPELAVEPQRVDAVTTTLPPRAQLVWTIPGREATTILGEPGDVPVAADLDGDGTTEHVVFRPTSGEWLVDGADAVVLGEPGDLPVPGDYLAEGRAQLAVFRPATGEWIVDGAPSPVVLGGEADVPVPAPYAVAGVVQPAVYRPSTGEWLVAGRAEAVRFGEPGDVPAPADYDGDGLADIAVFRPATGEWWVVGAAAPVVLGEPGDVPVPAAYAGSPTAVPAVYRPSTGELLVNGRDPRPTDVADGTAVVIRRRGAPSIAVVATER